MRQSPIDSVATFHRIERISRQVDEQDIDHLVITNRWDEPLAVRLPEFSNPNELKAIAVAAMDQQHRPDTAEPISINGSLPFDKHSRLPLPAQFTGLLDTVVQAACDDSGLRAHRLAESATGPWVGDALVHIDFPGQPRHFAHGPLQGLNVHLTLGGEGTVRFGQLRRWQQILDISRLVVGLTADSAKPLEIDTAVSELLHNDPTIGFSDAIDLRAGDSLIFQAGADWPDYLPVAHDFRSTTLDRRIIVFSPWAAAAEEVLAARQTS
jgi:hypothetical protein